MIDLAARLHLTHRARRYGPCPACRADVDRSGRPPLHHAGRSWYCNACHETMSDVALVKAALNMTWKSAYAWLDNEASAAPVRPAAPAPEPVLPPREQLEAELKRSIPLTAAPAHALAFLAERGISVQAPARWLDRPRLLQPGYPLVVPAYTGRGELASLHGRSVPTRTPKTTNPRGFDFTGLLFVSPSLLPFLRGEAEEPNRFLIVEGVTDYLRVAPFVPTIGIVSGSSDALRLIPVRTAKVFACMDVGPAGDRYLQRIADAMHPIPVRPVPLGRITQAVPPCRTTSRLNPTKATTTASTPATRSMR